MYLVQLVGDDDVIASEVSENEAQKKAELYAEVHQIDITDLQIVDTAQADDLLVVLDRPDGVPISCYAASREVVDERVSSFTP